MQSTRVIKREVENGRFRQGRRDIKWWEEVVPLALGEMLRFLPLLQDKCGRKLEFWCCKIVLERNLNGFNEK